MEGFTAALAKSLGNLKAPAIGKDYSANYEQYILAVRVLTSVFAVVGVLSHDSGYRIGLDNFASGNNLLPESSEVWEKVVADVLRVGARSVGDCGVDSGLGASCGVSGNVSAETLSTALASLETEVQVKKNKKLSKSTRNRNNRKVKRREAAAANALLRDGLTHGASDRGVGGTVGDADVMRVDVCEEGVVVGGYTSAADCSGDSVLRGDFVGASVPKGSRELGLEPVDRVRRLDNSAFSDSVSSGGTSDSEGSVYQLKMKAQKLFWKVKCNQNAIRIARQEKVIASESESSGDNTCGDKRVLDRLHCATKRVDRLAAENKVLRALVSERMEDAQRAEAALGSKVKVKKPKRSFAGFV